MHHRYRNAVLLFVILFSGLLASQRTAAQPAQPIVLLNPGDQSQVTSPFTIRALVYPGDDSLVRVILVDQQQNVLARQVLRVDVPNHGAVDLKTELAFEIPVERITAFLMIMTQDHVKRPIAIRSVPITLLRSGEMVIEPQLMVDPWLEVDQPGPGAVITDSPISITGRAWPIYDRPVIFELVTDTGSVIVTRQLAVGSAGEMLAYDMSLPYMSSQRIRDIRLTIRQPSGIAGVNLILDSLPLTIMP